MYQVNHLLSAKDNLVNLINTAFAPESGRRVTSSDFTFGATSAITPDGSGNNSQLTLTGVSSDWLSGSVVAKYKRFTLADNRPSAGTDINCVSADTLSTVTAAIVARLRLVASEVTVTGSLPIAGLSSVLTLSAKDGSSIYAPGTLAITVHNTDELGVLNPSFFFGASPVSFQSRKVYVVPQQDPRDYATYEKTDRQCFIDLLNDQALGTITESNITFGVPTRRPAGQIPGIPGDPTEAIYNTYVTFDPAAGSHLSEGGIFLYRRWTGLASFQSGLPDSVRLAAPSALAEAYFRYMHMSMAKLTEVSVTPNYSGGRPALFYTVPPGEFTQANFNPASGATGPFGFVVQ